MANMSGDMAETSVTDFFALPKLRASKVVGPGGNWRLCLKETVNVRVYNFNARVRTAYSYVK